MKIRQCFLELQLKILGMFFFETHCSILLLCISSSTCCVQDSAILNVVNLTTVKIVAPVKRLQTKTQVNINIVQLIIC